MGLIAESQLHLCKSLYYNWVNYVGILITFPSPQLFRLGINKYLFHFSYLINIVYNFVSSLVTSFGTLFEITLLVNTIVEPKIIVYDYLHYLSRLRDHCNLGVSGISFLL